MRQLTLRITAPGFFLLSSRRSHWCTISTLTMWRRLAASTALVLLSTVHASGQTQTALTIGEVEGYIERIGEVIERESADPELGTEIRRSLREGLAEGRFQSIYTVSDVATALTQELDVLTQDARFAVSIPTGQGNDAGRVDAVGQAGSAIGGIVKGDTLPGNVGYLQVGTFQDGVSTRDAIAGAMKAVRSADALIVDLRESTGDSAEVVAVLSSYLFPSASQTLFEISYRSAPSSRYSTLFPMVPDGNGTRPLFLLTSSKTSGAGELLALVVKDGRRGEAIGETTAGRAGPRRVIRLDERLEVDIPGGQVTSGFTGMRWKAGVKPDVAVRANDALRTAHVRALTQLLAASPAGDRRDQLARALEQVESSGAR